MAGMLKIDWATHKAAKYACEHWHYSKTIPRCGLVKVGVWEGGTFIGCIIYSFGATKNLVTPYGLILTEGCELTRIALKKHKNYVSKMLSLSLKFLKKSNPGLRLVVSFADPEQGHHGGIYQATNWVYTGITNKTSSYIDGKGRKWHARNVGQDLRKPQTMALRKECTKVEHVGKHRYLMPLDDEMRQRIEPLRQPYPKREKQAMTGTTSTAAAQHRPSRSNILAELSNE